MKLAYLLIFLITTFSLSAQLTNKGDFIITSGTTVYVTGMNIHNDNGTSHTWSNNGTFIFKGDDFINDGTMDATATGTTEFSGANQQTIQGSSIAYFHNLNINNTNNSVIQQSFVDTDNMTVNNGSQDFDYKVETDKSLTVNDVVTLSGDLRLMGTSQLLQTHTGTTSNSGSAYIWIDQQGTTNQYYYNYWSAPVNQSGEWKVSYLRDGAEGDNNLESKYPIINTVISTSATNDLPTQSHPVTLNAYWFFAFKNAPDGDYQSWYDNHIQNTGTVVPGEGYTMKGPGVDKDLNPANGNETSEYESWTFAGTPNDGEYSLTIDAGNDYLIGNPFPSAFDADQFIKDNISTGNGGNNTVDVFNGALYFWEHTNGDNHITVDYQGGYATYNLTGGVAATDWQTGTSVGTKTPKRYIPVAQGFFIWSETSNDGGNITFKNAQRKFEVEGANSAFIRPAAGLTDIRIGFDTPTNYHRQLLLGMRPNTTNGIDIGWDGPNFDYNYPEADMYWLINNERSYIIQAVPEINIDSSLPLRVVIDADNTVSFTLDAVENLPAGINDLYIYDASNNSYNLISETQNYDVFLNAGTYDDRFELVFRDANATNAEELQLENVSAYFDSNNSEIVIVNYQNKYLSKISMFALTGQEVLSQNVDTDASNIRIPAHLTTGVYLLKVISGDNKAYTTKMMIK